MWVGLRACDLGRPVSAGCFYMSATVSEQTANSSTAADWESSRRDKLQRIAELGHDPWGSKFDDHSPIVAIRGRAGEIVYRTQDGREVGLPDLEKPTTDFDFR